MEKQMTAKLTIALMLLLGASSAALAANHHRHYYGPHYGPHYGYSYGAWQRGYGGMLPNDTSRSVEYQMDMGQWSGKINAR
jgi:Spy/CpxP family protein refolding chaperone